MKKDLKKVLSSSGAKSLYSILILVSSFAVICLLIIFMLGRIGLIKVGGKAPEIKSPTEDENYQIGKIDYSFSPIEINNDVIAEMLKVYPFVDNYFVEFTLMHATNQELSLQSVRQWKKGDCYRIIINDINTQNTTTIVSNGKNVYYLDGDNNVINEFDYSEEYSFDNIGYYPSFLLIGDYDYQITNYEQKLNEISISYNIDLLKIEEKITVSGLSSMIKSTRTYCDGNLISTYDMNNYILNFDFPENFFVLEVN